MKTKLKIFFYSNKFKKLLELIFIISLYLLLFKYLLQISNYIYNYLYLGLDLNTLCMHVNSPTDNLTPNPQDPVNWRPFGLPQTLTILGTALGIYRLSPGSPRIKSIIALGSLSVSIPLLVFNQAVENPNGFNKLMYSIMEFRRTGKWPKPNQMPSLINDEQLNPIVNGSIQEKAEELTKSSNNITGSNNLSKSFLDNNDENINSIIDIIMNNIFKPKPVTGYLDDLLGLQMFIYFLLIIVVLGIIILFVGFLFIILFLLNKEYILNKFNNKYILFYLKYQVILGKITFIIIPFFILFGLINLIIGLNYLITHPLPYEDLGLDLHIYINKK